MARYKAAEAQADAHVVQKLNCANETPIHLDNLHPGVLGSRAPSYYLNEHVTPEQADLCDNPNIAWVSPTAWRVKQQTAIYEGIDNHRSINLQRREQERRDDYYQWRNDARWYGSGSSSSGYQQGNASG